VSGRRSYARPVQPESRGSRQRNSGRTPSDKVVIGHSRPKVDRVPSGTPAKNRPPGFIHIVVQGGELADAFETFTYTTSEIWPVRDGLMRTEERRQLAALGLSGDIPMGVFLGERSWAGHRGELILAPPFTYSDSIHADHLIFLWRSDGRDHAVSLHAWEPFTESVATLQAVVDSIAEREATLGP
jgi:hypothetical protein